MNEPFLVCVVCFLSYGHETRCPRCREDRWPETSADADTLVRERVEVILDRRTSRQRDPLEMFLLFTLGLVLRSASLYLGVLNGLQRAMARRWPRSGLGIRRRRTAAMVEELGAASDVELSGDKMPVLLTKAEEADRTLLARLAAGFDPATAPLLEALDWLGAKRTP